MTDPEPPRTSPEWLEWRARRRFPPGHPDYDAFYDASDDELAAMVSDALANTTWSEIPLHQRSCPDDRR